MISIIVCVDKNYGIGKNGELLCRISDDMKRFRKKTMGKIMIMGRKTFESLPKILSGRKHIVVTNNKEYKVDSENVSVEHDIIDLINKYTYSEEEVVVIGGAEIYKQFIEYCSRLYITAIHESVEGADAFFNLTKYEFDPEIWGLTEQSEDYYDKTNNVHYRFLTVERRPNNKEK